MTKTSIGTAPRDAARRAKNGKERGYKATHTVRIIHFQRLKGKETPFHVRNDSFLRSSFFNRLSEGLGGDAQWRLAALRMEGLGQSLGNGSFPLARKKEAGTGERESEN